MKAAFLAALFSVGPGPDNGIELMQIIAPVHKNIAEVTSTVKYVPAIVAADNKADIAPQVTRHVSTGQS